MKLGPSFAAFLVSLFVLTATAQERSIAEEIIKVNADMTSAADAQDFETFFDYILEEYPDPIVQDGRLFNSKAAAREAVERASQGIAKTTRTFRKTEVSPLSDTAALLTAEGTVTATLHDGRSIVREFAVSLVFVQRNGRWKLLHGHYSVPDSVP